MDQITLANTELQVSRACFGTMTFGSQVTAREARLMIDLCLDRGVNFFDTANIYNNGQAEEVLGSVLGGRRARVVVATKVRGKMGSGPDDVGLSPAAIRKAVESSLKRVQTDYIDIYYFHLPDYDVPILDSLRELDSLVRQGKVRYAGTSNYAAWQMAEILSLCRSHGLSIPWITQPLYNLLARNIETEFLPMARHFGFSTVAYNPLAGGILTGKQSIEAPLPGSRFDGNTLYMNRYWYPAIFDAVEQVRMIAGATGRSMTSVAINWLLHHTPVNCVILGASRLAQLEENLEACDHGPLPAETVVDLDAVWAQVKGPAAKYCR